MFNVKPESYIDVINLPLDFSKELPLPENFDEFESAIKSNNFKYGFKIYSNRMVPFSEGVEPNSAFYITKDLKELFNQVQSVEYFYISIVDGIYLFHVDKNINTGKVAINNGLSKPRGEIEILTESFLIKVINLLKLKKKEITPNIVIDPYITQYILGYIKSFFNIKESPLIYLNTIRESDDSFFVEFEKVKSNTIDQPYIREIVISKTDLKINND